ncbi:muts domain V-domain-containing protein [Mycena maculata]|uniref:DNA mismatch repair protein MSH3 n=1 Tax=Mycena maculata TaxID=230809 RepID=A0AAD7N0X0_9AGAR|nr:muts domain V-domain-containing protein [Mycena maculata]
MPSSSPSRQARISTFFSPTKIASKRPASHPSLGVDSPEPPSKKKKVAKSGESEPPVASSSRGAAEQWRFTSSSAPEKVVPSLETSARRDAFRNRLSENKSSKAVDPPPEVITVSSDSDSDHAFTELTQMFSSKSGKGKTKKVSRKPKAVDEIGPSGETWTPLEKQVLRLKKDNPSALLMIEVGYKYKFFGEDAKVAAKELGMVCFHDRNFLVASIPTHRKDIHLKKLLSHGYKVGIVQQVETAALKKAGDNRNAPFERKLVQLFTAATYVDDIDSIDELDKYAAPRLVCIIEGKSDKASATGADVCIGMISVSPSVGDVVWDAFDDSPMRIELETRLVHLRPTEVLLQRNGLSRPTDRMLKHFTEVPGASAKIRTERFDESMPFTEAFDYVSSFYSSDPRSHDNSGVLATITDFPKPVIIALACTIQYLSAFDIATSLSQTSFFTRFATKTHMLLAGNTLANLEIFQNETDYNTRGSLVWILDKTVTSFGARMLKNWIGKPLVDKCALKERIDAVEEIVDSSSEKLATLRQLLKRLPDLAKGLCRIQYKQCTPQELAILLPAFYKIGNAFPEIQTPVDIGLKSRLLNDIILSLPRLKKPLGDLLAAINLKETAAGNKDCMWKDASTKFPSVDDHKLAIQAVEVELDQELMKIRKTLKLPSLKFCTAAGEEYLIEVKKSDRRPIPDSYLPAISKTKYVERYRSPGVKAKIQELARWQESLQIEAKKAYLTFLDEVIEQYAILRDAVNKLATADCLISLAQVALRDSYVKPQFIDDADTLEIVDGRHPMVEALRSDPFVPNTILFSKEGQTKVITGPNMGGKSSCVRMVALIAIMAQIGSYVPATSVKLAALDSVQTRMGAYDEIARGRSTFMVEMTETSEILHAATQNSLVILDELGRGTSTFDGMAIAYAVLNQLVASTRCKTLFITHYPLVATELEEKFPARVQNLHVGYRTDNRGIDGQRDVTFLYRLTQGIARESFGVECARLAGLPESILENATRESLRMETAVVSRMKRNTFVKTLQLLRDLQRGSPTEAVAIVEKLRATLAP